MSPALAAVVIQNGTGITSGGYLHGRFAGAQIDDGEESTHFARAVTSIVGIPEAEITAVINSPALEAVVAGDGARPASTGFRGDDRSGERTRDAVARIPHVARAGSRAQSIRAGRIRIAPTVVRQAFVDVRARDAISGISRIARARTRSGRIRTRSIGITSAVVDLAFVDVRARVSITGIPAVAGAGAIRTRCIRAAIRVRRTRRRRTRAGAIAHARAFTVRIRIGRDERANAVVTGAFLRRRTSVTKSAAMVVAAETVDAIRRQTLRRRRTRLTIVGAASARARASSNEAFIVGIRVVLDRTAEPVGAALLLCRRARHTRAVAGRIAAEAVDTIHRSALRRRIAGRTVG